MHSPGSGGSLSRSQRRVTSVSASPRSTNTRRRSTSPTSLPTPPMETSPQSTLFDFLTSTSSAEDSPARPSAFPESVEDSPTPEELCSSIFAGSSKPSSLASCYLRTSKDSSPTTTEAPSERFWPRWMNWGTTCNGRCVTARISASPKTGNVCSFSAIEEIHHDPKYFLSQEQVALTMRHVRDGGASSDGKTSVPGLSSIRSPRPFGLPEERTSESGSSSSIPLAA